MSRLLRLLSLLVLAVVLFTPSRAEARRGLVLITHGDTIKHVADLPSDVAEQVRENIGETPAVGYKYSAFGVFWLDIWTWDGQHCLYHGDTYYDATPEQIAELLGVSVDELPKPWGYTFPPGLLVIVAIVAIWIPISIKNKAKNKQLAQRFESLMEDSRYQNAIEIISAQSADTPDSEEGDDAEEPAETLEDIDKPDPFDDAVQSLVNGGIDREEATENLSFIISVLVAHANAEEDA